MSRKPPSAIALYAMREPVRYAVWDAVAGAIFAAGLIGRLGARVALVTAVVGFCFLLLLNLWVWGPRGPARRWVQGRLDRPT